VLILVTPDMNNVDLLFDDPPPPRMPPPLPPRPAARAVQFTNFKLPEFWVDSPVGWFGAAEAQFLLRGVVSEVDKFCLLTQALHKESVKEVIHLVAHPDPVRPYSLLKQALLASHQLTDFQRVEQLLAMEPLGSRKPSQLLAAMLELCPRDEQGSKFFVALFLQRLPAEMRVLLAHDDHSDLRQLAAKADQLQAYQRRQAHETVAVAAETEESVAAVKKTGGKGGRKGVRPPPPPDRKKQGPPRQPAPADIAAQAAGLCFYHWTFGERARDCRPPCKWQGAEN